MGKAESMARFKAQNEQLKSDDERFELCARLLFTDGTSMFFEESFLMGDPEDKDFVWLFCLKRPSQLIALDDLNLLENYDAVGVENLDEDLDEAEEEEPQ